MMGYWLRGVGLGLAVAVPLGPIGVMCLRRTLVQGRRAGLATGLGAASADMVYAALGAGGLAAAASVLAGGWQAGLQVVGGLFLAYLGIRTLKSRPADQSGPVDGAVLAASFATTFFLTITNPMTILSFAAAFASVGVIGEPGQRASGAALWVLGVFSGSMLWWLILTSVTARFRGFLTPGRLLWLHRLAGIMLLGFGLAALVMGSGTLG